MGTGKNMIEATNTNKTGQPVCSIGNEWLTDCPNRSKTSYCCDFCAKGFNIPNKPASSKVLFQDNNGAQVEIEFKSGSKYLLSLNGDAFCALNKLMY